MLKVISFKMVNDSRLHRRHISQANDEEKVIGVVLIAIEANAQIDKTWTICCPTCANISITEISYSHAGGQ